jgi:DNA mismatch repair ATPase MutS
MEDDTGRPLLNYSYTISDGVCQVENYGIHAAQMAGLDVSITLRAMEISKILESVSSDLEEPVPSR